MTALRQNKLLVGRAGDNMIRLLPPLNVLTHMSIKHSTFSDRK